MKKRILIAVQYMEIGGVERSLLGMLEAFDYDRFDVDLFVYRHSGELMRHIPPRVNLLPEIPAYAALTRPIARIAHRYPAIALGRAAAKIKARRFGKRNAGAENNSVFQYAADATTRRLPDVNDTMYDLAVSFIAPHNIVRDRVRARRKAAWIHTDYSNVAIDTACEIGVWGAFDAIGAVSEQARQAFVSKFPTLSDRVVVIENILSVSTVRQSALGNIPDEMETPDTIKLLTVGRFCYAKAFDRAVAICAQLVGMGFPVRWYAVGYGDERPIREAISRYSMEERFLILGKRENPYPCIRACDIYVQPSRYEGKAVAVREAQALGKPVVITAFETSAGQLRDGFDGLIVPMDIEAAARGIGALIADNAMRERLRANAAATDYANAAEVEKIYALI